MSRTRKADNPTKFHRHNEPRPCRRCGVPMQWSHNPLTKTPGICRDCRTVDPEFVRAIASGQPVVQPRTVFAAPNFAERRRAEWESLEAS